GFIDFDGSITGTPGRFVGSGQPVLFADGAAGPNSYRPGFVTGLGYRFSDASAVEINWMFINTVRFTNPANFTPPLLQGGANLENTFVLSPVFNFPPQFNGPAQKVAAGAPGATIGIWNAATEEIISFMQQTQQIEAAWRIPIQETECWRTYG